MTKARHAEIAGAGMVGLAAAAALARRGWSVRVHERNAELREIGAGIAVWSNGVYALREVGAYEEAVAGTDRIDHWQLRDEKNRLVQEEWLMSGVSESYAILRPRLHQALANAARRYGAEIVTGSPVAGATPDGKLLLESGEALPADLVVGADGVGSRVRDSLGLARRVRDLHDGCGRHLIPRLPDDPNDMMVERWNGGRRIGIVPCTKDQVYIYLCCPEADVAGRNQSHDLSTWIETFPEFARYIKRIPPGGVWRSFADAVVTNWSRGKVALVGDAASAMSPNLGQAACVGMVNAVALAQALDAYLDVETALAKWEQAERPVTDSTQKYSRFYGWIGTHWPRPALGVRSALIWTLAHSKHMQQRINVAARHVPAVGTPIEA
ncbi:FAD-dependent monooxygenase [Planosporangium flavigriseum]|uniref:Monooxygenase n=1 Tax=Planosporangium flavigriseum TaxID=373681 RepID=A0A8J3LSY8_9ACTN|nr:NAD(P)/FAD-dependent oxidoreductase [Planosporangium flavigriseum]NJC65272.1 FAD-dependent monooxygenase [Planosporangium flavigriseum]GIG73374.1 monooxygenase [Planosporangium flavigriseum]